MIEIASQEHLMLGTLAVGNRPQDVAHAVLRDHAAHDARRMLNVLRSARRDLLQDDLFGDASAHRDLELVHEFRARRVGAILLGQHQRVAARPAARNDRDLVHGISVRQEHADERMTALVIRRQFLLLVRHDLRAALRPRHDALDGLFQLVHADALLVAPRCQESRLVHEVRQIRAREARRAPREDVEIDITRQRLALRVNLQDREPAAHIGLVDDDLAVEAAGAQKRGIKDVGTVRRRHDDDAFIGREAIHLDEQLVERLLALVVTAADARAALAADGVDLVDEDDARRVLLRLIEEVAHARGADTDEHLDKV